MKKGFTLIELAIVVGIIGLLYFTIIPIYATTIKKAKEAALKESLYILRKMLDQYYKDKECWPPNLESLVKEGYIRSIPVDPITGRNDTWIIVPSDFGINDVYDVKSGAHGTSLEGTPYSSW